MCAPFPGSGKCVMTRRAEASAALFRAALAALVLALVVLFHERIELVFERNAPMSDRSGDVGVIALPERSAQQTSPEFPEPEAGMESAIVPIPLAAGDVASGTDAEPEHEAETALEEGRRATREDPAAAATNARATAPITEIAQPFPLEAAPDAGPEADRQSILDNRLSASPERMAEAPAEESLIPPPISESGRHWLRADDFMPLTEAQELFAVARDAGYVGSILYRVVEGPFPARADMMQGDGQESIVVGQAGRWWRQFGLFAHKENAERFAEQLNQQGHDVVLQGQPEFGPYAHASDAEAGLAILRQMVERPFLAARIVAR